MLVRTFVNGVTSLVFVWKNCNVEVYPGLDLYPGQYTASLSDGELKSLMRKIIPLMGQEPMFQRTGYTPRFRTLWKDFAPRKLRDKTRGITDKLKDLRDNPGLP